MEPPTKLPSILDRAEFRLWAEMQPRGRYERVGGEVVAMAPQRAAHVRVKARAWQALDQAIRAAGLDCEAFGDGIGVEIGEDADYEPDALVACGERLAEDAIAAPTPIIVVEVLSPSMRSLDIGAKLSDYFRVPSIQHHLIIRADRRMVSHHRRSDGDRIETRLVAQGRIDLDPPGISVAVEEFYAP